MSLGRPNLDSVCRVVLKCYITRRLSRARTLSSRARLDITSVFTMQVRMASHMQRLQAPVQGVSTRFLTRASRWCLWVWTRAGPDTTVGLASHWCAVVTTARRFKDFFISAMEDFQETPKVVDAAHKLGLDSTSDVIPGLEVQLMPHQLIGVSWMVEREAKANIKGGILA